jgi:hypothetical protein
MKQTIILLQEQLCTRYGIFCRGAGKFSDQTRLRKRLFDESAETFFFRLPTLVHRLLTLPYVTPAHPAHS